MITQDTLQEVIKTQREFLGKEEVSTPREKEREVIIEHSFAFIITGIRRCGKSTFLNQLLKKHKETSLMLLSNLKKYGSRLTGQLYSGNYKCLLKNGRAHCPCFPRLPPGTRPRS